MNVTATPQFLVVEVPDLVAANATFDAWQPLLGPRGGTCLASALPRDVQVLEAGTRLAAVLIARFDDAPALEAFWNAEVVQRAFDPVRAIGGSRAVSVKGVPSAGLPGDFLPTVATVTAPVLPTPPAYMLVQGSVTNLAAIQEYVGIIMPMLRERGGYYVVYAEAPDVTVLHGAWSEQAYIVSRWPTLALAQDFWFCERYQHEAIPTRTGHGAFTVLLMPGRAG
jgi:uncharacterized protein (DUF1330 family)